MPKPGDEKWVVVLREEEGKPNTRRRFIGKIEALRLAYGDEFAEWALENCAPAFPEGDATAS